MTRRNLTEQQATIYEWAKRGYPARDIARIIKRTPAQVFDQIGLIRKKGYEVELASARDRTLNREESVRIAKEAKHVG